MKWGNRIGKDYVNGDDDGDDNENDCCTRKMELEERNEEISIEIMIR